MMHQRIYFNSRDKLIRLDIQKIVTYVKSKTAMAAKWEDVPSDIKDTFEKLGIPEAERQSLAGVGAQYDSELVYHNVKDEVSEQGVVYTDFESALISRIIVCRAKGRFITSDELVDAVREYD